MKGRASNMMIIGLTMLIIFFIISTSYAGAKVVIQGRVTFLGLGIKGAKVEAIGGAQITETETMAFGFYTMLHDIKHFPTTVKVTAFTRYGDKSREIKDVNPGQGPYWISFHFGFPDSQSNPVNKNSKNSCNINTYQSINPIFLKILEQHPHMFSILRCFRGV